MSIPDVLIERYLLGEVTDTERRLVEADPSGLARVERLRAESAEILRTFDAAAVAREARARRAERRRGRGWRLGILAVATAAAAVAVLAVAPAPDSVRARGGDPELRVYRQTEGAPVALSSGDAAAAGDIVQLAIVRGADPYGVVVSIDGAGSATLHFPRDGDTSLADSTVVLEQAYRLDDAPRFERFFLVTSDTPVDVEEVLGAARQLAGAPDARTATLGVPEDLRQRELLLVKP
jgi:hypothetical protein